MSSLIEQERALRARVVEFLARYRSTKFLAAMVQDIHYDAVAKGHRRRLR